MVHAGVILMVEDEQPVQEVARLYLEREGFRVASALDGEEALQKVRSENPDLVVLDIMLPKKDGWTVCREIRRHLAVPIIMLSAKGEEYDRVLGLELGADDYITKPFSPRELVARVKAVLRRSSAAAGEAEAGEVFRYPGLTVDTAAHLVKVHGETVPLTPKEFELLAFLAARPRRVLNREQLLAGVWGYEYPGDTRTVDTHIKRLREKLRGTGRSYLRTVWGLGYKFEV
ncbi:MAG: response regulator transcription factor [Candidatus Desulforudis sp.]|nr:response regulator transcription factor [Desulforudis sp.]